MHKQANFYILTGAMGAGKSTVLAQLKVKGFTTVNEPAREILAEQRAIEGVGVPESNRSLFTELLLSRAMCRYEQYLLHVGPVVFDRGIADNIAYAEFFNLKTHHFLKAARVYKYNPTVFWLPPWREIYMTDEERKMSFESAEKFGYHIKHAYEYLGYHVLEVPQVSPQARADFVAEHINAYHAGS